MKHVIIRVHGRVQGVMFRVSTLHKADTMGIVGFVRNEPDGSVYIEAEGTAKQIEEFISWCKVGPHNAYIDEIEVEEGKVEKFARFTIESP